jgi:hypothetical protein
VGDFQVHAPSIAKLARNHRFAADLVRLVWPELLSTGSVVPKSRRVDMGHRFLDEWEPRYREHVVTWADENVERLEGLLASLGQELAWVLDELGGHGGRPHGGGG